MKLADNDTGIMGKLTFYLYLISLVLIIFLLVIDIDVISVIHSRSGENLPVIERETYSFQGLNLSYIFVFLIIINLIIMKIEGYSFLKNVLVSLTTIVAVALFFVFFINPHLIILFPSGLPPTKLENVLIGGVFIIGLLFAFLLNSSLLIYQQGNLRIYLIAWSSFISAALLAGLIHETGHLLFGVISGGKIITFIPFPIFQEGEFILGLVRLENISSDLQPLFLLGGEILQWITMSLILFIFYKFPRFKNNLFVNFLLLIAWLDFPLYTINNYFGIPHWFIAGRIEGDIIQLASLMGISYWVFFSLALIQIFIGLAYIFKRVKNSQIYHLKLKNKGEKN
ncbi:MAG: membrane protein of unknown function [Promethearchaeota archaeon]|nr:MAG: membrane protein of unknown function [Candidatus Lokiarchaeota archaeon]